MGEELEAYYMALVASEIPAFAGTAEFDGKVASRFFANSSASPTFTDPTIHAAAALLPARRRRLWLFFWLRPEDVTGLGVEFRLRSGRL
jgi:hypothetical protein